MKLYGQHRSLELAERHRAELEKQLGMEVITVARRNSLGRFSKRGQHFTFESIPPEEKDFEDLTLEEFEDYMDRWDGDIEEVETETSGDYGDE